MNKPPRATIIAGNGRGRSKATPATSKLFPREQRSETNGVPGGSGAALVRRSAARRPTIKIISSADVGGEEETWL